jgi:putative ABC transport system ATP-binding protein
MINLQGIQRDFRVGEQIVHALKDVVLQVERGEYLSIMGPSGSGKSTLLHIIGLLDRPTVGEYRLDENDVTDLSDAQMARTRREKIGFIFQFFHLVPRLSAAENVELPLTLAGKAPAERKERVDRLIEAYGLTDRGQHRPDQLSGGQRQRVAIARATVMEPEILLADEPTGNLDRSSGKEVIELLEGLNRQGKTLLVVTHDPELGGRARRRMKMMDGRIVQDTLEGKRSEMV